MSRPLNPAMEANMTVTIKEKELAAVGISIAAGCKPCTDYHMKAVREAGAADTEIRQAVEQAAAVRNAASGIMLAHGLAHLGDEAMPPAVPAAGDRQAILTGLGAAFAVNCTSSLERYIELADDAEVTDLDAVEIAKLARFIKGKGASHVERRIEAVEKNTAEEPAAACCD